jgi:nucleotide-binding universal stress UspA family protein
MRSILCATDISRRAERAIDRAAALARQFGASLRLLHVVDEDQPRATTDMERLRARDALEAQVQALNDAGLPSIEIAVEAGVVFQTIVTAAQDYSADVIVMGAHRKRVLKDIVIGTTIERVMRTGLHPVLMVNADANARYESVLLALDGSKASEAALTAAKALRLLDDTRLSVIRAFEPASKGMVLSVSVAENPATDYSEAWEREARKEITNLIRQAELPDVSMQILTEEGPPFLVIRRAIEHLGADLLVVGTHGRTGVSRVLLGSVAERVISSEVECDVLVVPAGGVAS